MSGLETGLGLDIVLWLQAHGNGLFDILAKALHFIGFDLTYLGLLLVIYWRVDKRLGLRLLLLLALTNITASLLKVVLQTPRPYQISADVVTLVEQGGYGIPSGHVASALAVLGYIALWYKNRRLMWGVVFYTLLMGWSRMYNGVHFPQDVIAGLLVGALVLWIYRRVSVLGHVNCADDTQISSSNNKMESM